MTPVSLSNKGKAEWVDKSHLLETLKKITFVCNFIKVEPYISLLESRWKEILEQRPYLSFERLWSVHYYTL